MSLMRLQRKVTIISMARIGGSESDEIIFGVYMPMTLTLIRHLIVVRRDITLVI